MQFRKVYGIDLGNSTIKIYSNMKNKTYVEKNLIAYRGRRILAVGNEAYEMLEKTPADISVDSPMALGVIADVELQEITLYSLMKKTERILGLGADVYFVIPMDMTTAQKQAYYNVVNGKWLRKNRVFITEAPIADALSMGLTIDPCIGIMMVNIGAQSTQFSVICDGKIMMSRQIPIGGKQINESICSEVRKRYNLSIGTRTGKRLKLAMGRLMDQKKDARRVVGIDSVSGLPREAIITSYVVNAAIMDCVNSIASEMKTFLERIPPQIAYQIQKEGIYLTGGSTRLPFIENYLASYTGYTFNLSEMYEASSVRGLERIIRDPSLKKWAQPIKRKIKVRR